MPVDGPSATVIDVTDLVGGGRDRELRQVLAPLRTTVIEPPPMLLPAILARVDDASRFSWPVPARAPRWVAYAGGVAAGAAGAVMLASRSRRLPG